MTAVRLVAALAVPVVAAAAELAALLAVAHVIGLPAALLILAAISVVGVVLVRRAGGRAWQRFRQAAGSGRPPGAEATDGLIGLAAALLVAFPGYLTAVTGAVLLIPPVRARLGRAAGRAAARRIRGDLAGQMFGPATARVRRAAATDNATVVDGEIVEP